MAELKKTLKFHIYSDPFSKSPFRCFCIVMIATHCGTTRTISLNHRYYFEVASATSLWELKQQTGAILLVLRAISPPVKKTSRFTCSLMI